MKFCKRGNILTENVIFIILNLIFLSILIIFLFKQGSGDILMEQSYAKQIALLIDSAPPGTIIKLDMAPAEKLAEKNGLDFYKKGEIAKIDGNEVIVRLSEKGGYSYTFFNDVAVDAYPNKDNKGFYIFTIN